MCTFQHFCHYFTSALHPAWSWSTPDHCALTIHHAEVVVKRFKSTTAIARLCLGCIHSHKLYDQILKSFVILQKKKKLSLRCTVLCCRIMEERKFHHCIPRAHSGFERKKKNTRLLPWVSVKKSSTLNWHVDLHPLSATIQVWHWFIKSINNGIISMATRLVK